MKCEQCGGESNKWICPKCLMIKKSLEMLPNTNNKLDKKAIKIVLKGWGR